MTSLGSCLCLKTVDIIQGMGAKELLELYGKNTDTSSVALVRHVWGSVSVMTRGNGNRQW